MEKSRLAYQRLLRFLSTVATLSGSPNVVSRMPISSARLSRSIWSSLRWGVIWSNAWSFRRDSLDWSFGDKAAFSLSWARKGQSLSLFPLYFSGSRIFRCRFILLLLLPLKAASMVVVVVAAVVMVVVAVVSAFWIAWALARWILNSMMTPC